MYIYLYLSLFRDFLHKDELIDWMDGVERGFPYYSCYCRAAWCHPCNPGCEEENSPKCQKHRQDNCDCLAPHPRLRGIEWKGEIKIGLFLHFSLNQYGNF